MQEMKTCFVELFKPNISALNRFVNKFHHIVHLHMHTRHSIFFTVKDGKRQANARTGSPRPPQRITAVVTVRSTDRWAQDAESVNPPATGKRARQPRLPAFHHWKVSLYEKISLARLTRG
jgi:hypothetical protein